MSAIVSPMSAIVSSMSANVSFVPLLSKICSTFELSADSTFGQIIYCYISTTNVFLSIWIQLLTNLQLKCRNIRNMYEKQANCKNISLCLTSLNNIFGHIDSKLSSSMILLDPLVIWEGISMLYSKKQAKICQETIKIFPCVWTDPWCTRG